MKKTLKLVSTLVTALMLVASAGAASAKKTTRRKATAGPHRYYGNVKSVGGKYVFVYRGKSLAINNQNFPALKADNGKHVGVLATRKHDAVTITKLWVVKPRVRHAKSTAHKK